MIGKTFTPFGEPFTLLFQNKRETFGIWYRSSPKSEWHLYDHSQFFVWEKQTPNHNSGGGTYWYTMLSKKHSMQCEHVSKDYGEFGFLGQKLLAKGAAKKHGICRKCYRIARKRLLAEGILQARSEAGRADRLKGWVEWYGERKEDDWRNK